LGGKWRGCKSTKSKKIAKLSVKQIKNMLMGGGGKFPHFHPPRSTTAGVSSSIDIITTFITARRGSKDDQVKM